MATHSSPEASTPVEDSVSIQEIFNTMLEKAWLIALCVIITTGCGVYYVMKSDVLYTAHTVIQLNQQENSLMGDHGEDLKADALLKTSEQNLTTDALFALVIRENNLQHDATFVPHPGGSLPSLGGMQRVLASRVEAKARRGTRLIDVWLDDTDPARAQKLANSLVDQFSKRNSELLSTTSETKDEYLQKQAVQLQARVEASAEALQNYQKEHNTVSLENNTNVIKQKLEDLNQAYTQANAARIKMDADLASVERNPDDVDKLLAIRSIADSSDVLGVKARIVEQQSAIGALAKRYKSRHPKYVNAQSQLSALQSELRSTVLRVASTFASQLATARDTEEKLQAAVHDQEKTAMELGTLSVKYNVLKQQLDSDQALYNAVISQQNTIGVAKGFEDASFRIIQPADAPTYPSEPKTKLIITFAVVFGFLVGFGLTFLLSTVDSSLRTVDQVESFTGLSAIGAIPLMERSRRGSDKAPSKMKILVRSLFPFLAKGSSPDRSLVLVRQPDSPVSESFRTLRTNLALEISGGESKSILFTSAIPSEGKTFCSSNYAISLAQMNLKTLIVDCDLRRPAVAKAFAIEDDKVGLGQYLQGEAKWEQAVRKSSIVNLDIITVGRLVSNPSETLASQAMQDFLVTALSKYDRVVLDTAPVNAVSDTLLFASQASTVCLVIKAASTPRRAVKRAFHVLKQAKANLAGIVLNQLPIHSGLGYYYYYSSGSYGEAVYGSSTVKTS